MREHNKMGVVTIVSCEQALVRSKSMTEDILGLVLLLFFNHNISTK
jgi:hypothetical protein